MQRCFACSFSAQTDCTEKKKVFLSTGLRGTDECMNQLSCARGKVGSVEVFGLEAEAFPQDVVQNFCCQLTQCYCTTTGKQTVVVEMGWPFLCNSAWKTMWLRANQRNYHFRFFRFFGICKSKKSSLLAFEHKTITFCIAATILRKTDYGSNDYHVDRMETGLNLRES